MIFVFVNQYRMKNVISNHWCVPGEEDASLAVWGEESVLHQREMAGVFRQQFHPGLVSTWRPASLGKWK